MPWHEWRAVLKRTWTETGSDNIGLIAAGTAFYAFAAIVPMLAATVLCYGLFADAQTVGENIRSLFEVLPADVARIIGEQLATVTQSSDGKQGVGLVIALGIALYGGTKATSSIVTALNVAYEETETRGFIKLNLLAIGMVAGGVVLLLAAIASTTLLAFLRGLIPSAPDIVVAAIRFAGYLLLATFVVSAAALLYRYGPSRAKPRWSWLSPGAIAATLLWLAGTAGFGVYVANFGNYGATYGSLSAVIVLLTWLWLSAYVFLLGAELNSELERQTVHDTTTGAPVPMGARRAVVADTVVSQDIPTATAPESSSGTAGTAAKMKIAARLAGGPIGLPSALIAGAGFAALRRGSVSGLALVALAAGLAWRRRDGDSDDPQ